MSKGHLLRIAQCFLGVAALCLYLGPRSAAASTSVSADGLTLTLNTASTTVVEGSSLTLDFTATNSSGSNITNGGTAISLGSVTGDSSDTIQSISAVISLPCVELAPVSGGSCDLSLVITTPSGLGETDGDFGVTPITVSWETFGPPACPSVIGPGCVLTLTTDVTVEDPTTMTSTPEPSSVILFGTGLLGFGPLLRRRLARA